MSLPDMCQQTITVKTSAVTYGTMGGEVRASFVTSNDVNGNPLSEIAASIQNLSSQLIESYARRGIKISHAIYTETDISATRLGDIITDQNGTNYLVSDPTDMGAQGRCWSVKVNLIT